MTTVQLIAYLRSNVRVQSVTSDEAFLTLADSDLELYLTLAMSKDFPDLESLEDLPNEDTYPVVLLAKKELYFALATIAAPLYTISADGASLTQTQRFDHYLGLIKEIDKEYNTYIANGGAGSNVLTSYDVVLADRYATKYNYESSVNPAVSLYVKGVAKTYVEATWTVKYLSHFWYYKVYISTSPIYDAFASTEAGKVSASATCAVTIELNKNQNSCRVKGLVEGTTYYILVVAADKNGHKGYCEKIFTTATAASGTV